MNHIVPEGISTGENTLQRHYNSHPLLSLDRYDTMFSAVRLDWHHQLSIGAYVDISIRMYDTLGAATRSTARL
jgi:hypothetical protein